MKEAIELIKNGLLWVHQLNESPSSDICSIVATTRKSENVTAITKVYTNPLYRSRGCAERLVRRVCQQCVYPPAFSTQVLMRLSISALLKERKDSVVLFVAHDNLAAAKVYDRVGFQGLCGKPRAEGVDPWLEVGFQDTNLGHW
jgi:predicted GNAT family acetyltransferase